MTTRTFHLGDILSVTTGWLVSPRRMEGVVNILTWMTGERPEIQQIPRATGECRGPLLAQHPDLAAVARPTFADRPGSRQAAVARWLTLQVAAYGETREVKPLADGEHARTEWIWLLLDPDMEVTVMEMPPEPES